MDRVKRILYLSRMRAAKVQASLRIRAVSPEPSLLAHTSSKSRGTFRQKARSIAPLNGWACAVEICHDGMLEATNSLDGAQMKMSIKLLVCMQHYFSFNEYETDNNKRSTMSRRNIMFCWILVRYFYLLEIKKKKKMSRDMTKPT